jgi:hypothetical protein
MVSLLSFKISSNARNGLVGGWLINQNSISSPQQTISGKYYRTVFKPQGTLQGGQLTSDGSKKWKTSCMWKLNKDGRAWFTDVTITGGEIEIKKNNNTTFKVTNDGVLTCTEAYIGGVRFTQPPAGQSGQGYIEGQFNLNGWSVDTNGNFNNNNHGISFGTDKCEINATNGFIKLSGGYFQIDENNKFAGGDVGLITTKVTTQNLTIGTKGITDYIKGVIDSYVTKAYVEALGVSPASHTHSVSVSTNVNGTYYAGSGTANGW